MNQFFKIIGNIDKIQTIATSKGIREVNRLKKIYGGLRWRKKKGIALVQLPNENVVLAEIHWYEANGVGRKEIKIKRFIKNENL